MKFQSCTQQGVLWISSQRSFQHVSAQCLQSLWEIWSNQIRSCQHNCWSHVAVEGFLPTILVTSQPPPQDWTATSGLARISKDHCENEGFGRLLWAMASGPSRLSSLFLIGLSFPTAVHSLVVVDPFWSPDGHQSLESRSHLFPTVRKLGNAADVSPWFFQLSCIDGFYTLYRIIMRISLLPCLSTTQVYAKKHIYIYDISYLL